MKRIAIAVVAAALAGCGVETATTAATSAALKKQEIEAGNRTQEQLKQSIEQSMLQVQRRAQESEQR